jgi:hypothetical protein
MTIFCVLSSLASYLLLAGMTYGIIRKPGLVAAANKANEEFATLCGTLWPVTWIGWISYQFASAGPRIVRAMRKRKAEKKQGLPCAKVVRGGE